MINDIAMKTQIGAILNTKRRHIIPYNERNVQIFNYRYPTNRSSISATKLEEVRFSRLLSILERGLNFTGLSTKQYLRFSSRHISTGSKLTE